jgi:putative acetyltransferase
MNKYDDGQPGRNKIVIRKLVESDLDSCIRLFFETVHSVNTRDYTSEQLDAWAPDTVGANDPRVRTILNHIAYVAEINGVFVGFGDMTMDGYLDRLYVHHDYQRMGIASAIVTRLEERALKIGIKGITTHASITAKPFFESFGYVVCKQQEVDVGGVKLVNYIMKKAIK